jgi:PAS domain S-box-containing protein
MEAQHRGLLEAVPDAIVVINARGEIILMNRQAEQRFGYGRAELIGQDVKNIIPAGFAAGLFANGVRSAEEARTPPAGVGAELTACRKDGSVFPIEITLSHQDGREGIVVTVAIRDISERCQAEAHLQQKLDELKRSNEELRQFAYVASHDLQEPLRMVTSFLQLLSRRYTGRLDADADEFIAFAVDGAARMQGLIEGLLALSLIGAHKEAVARISSDGALERALMNLKGAIEESRGTVTHGLLPAVLADQGQLIQLFQNLVGNAIKYRSAAPPQVHVSALKNGRNEWVFSVHDNGLGIEPQHFEKIFGVFQRLHAREEFPGTGIGLAICKKIVESQGGSLSVESKPGHGSTFRFTLAGQS